MHTYVYIYIYIYTQLKVTHIVCMSLYETDSAIVHNYVIFILYQCYRYKILYGKCIFCVPQQNLPFTVAKKVFCKLRSYVIYIYLPRQYLKNLPVMLLNIKK